MEGGEEGPHVAVPNLPFEGCMLMWINDKRKPQNTWQYYILHVKMHEFGYGPFIQRGR